MKRRKTIIGVTILIAFIIIMALGIGGIKVVNANKINSSLELGIKYLTEGNYEEARLEFSKAISIYDKHEKATDLLALTEDYIELNELYANKEYLLVADLILKIKENKYLEYIESSVNEISTNTEEKIVIINEINNLDSQIQQLISENKFQEAIDLINKYLGEDLKQEYLDKLNELMNGVNESKTAYEEEQARIAEERRLEEERLAEEERRRQQEASNSKIKNTEQALARLKQVPKISEMLSGIEESRINIAGSQENLVNQESYEFNIRIDSRDGMFSVNHGHYLVKANGNVYELDISGTGYKLIYE
ncbi:hypothetical protein [Paraclostridium bifermentans]|uniref:hypothetical protein n=1 Tax=Paraclostridium bifermentans TaxID=1490 RepID=UPI00189E3968|nr:hypothetical protein [Paraclostridium bifermentans]